MKGNVINKSTRMNPQNSTRSYIKPNMTKEQFIGLCERKIRDGEPFAFCRIGDGEVKHFLNKFRQQHTERLFCKNWGLRWPEDLEKGRNICLKLICTAIQQSDVVGMLDLTNEVSKKLRATPEVWSLSTSDLKKNGITCCDHLKIVDHTITRSVEIGCVRGMAKLIDSRPVHIVSSRTTRLIQNNIGTLLNSKVSFTQVDNTTELSEKSRSELFEKMNLIEEYIVLISLSVIGKDIPAYLKKRGKFCLDMGATIDAWAGIANRPWFKKGSLQHHCLIQG